MSLQTVCNIGINSHAHDRTLLLGRQQYCEFCIPCLTDFAVQWTEKNNVTTAAIVCKVETSSLRSPEMVVTVSCYSTGTVCKVETPPFVKSGDRRDRQLWQYRYIVQGGKSAFCEVRRWWWPSVITVLVQCARWKLCLLWSPEIVVTVSSHGTGTLCKVETAFCEVRRSWWPSVLTVRVTVC